MENEKNIFDSMNEVEKEPVSTQPETAATETEATQAQQPADTGYVNVGSSGTNTANTAGVGTEADSASTAQSSTNQSYYQEPRSSSAGTGYTQSGPAYASNHSTQSHSAYDYSGSYSSGPRQEPPKKNSSASTWLKRCAALVLVAAVGFGGGYAGGKLAGSGSSQHVVYQQVTTAQSTAVSSTGLSTSDVAAMISPSVVAITTEQVTTGNYWFGGSYVVSGAGSGVIMTEDGYIITNNHVVSGATSITVTLDDNTQYSATLVGTDSKTDIAVVKIDATGLTPAVMGDSDSVAVGQTAIAVGNPLGTYSGSVTSGIISGLNREVTVEGQTMSLIQTDASVSPGNSGGGLFDETGALIGIVNSRSGSDSAENIGFAIPVNTALQVAQDLISSGYVTGRPALGIYVTTVTAENAYQYGLSQGGIYISGFTENSGAQAAGLQEGDLLVSVDDVLVQSTSDVTDYISNCSVGDVVQVQVQREGRLMTIEVTLGESVT